MKTRASLILALIALFVTETTVAEPVFGRLYTTPKQREQLDELRNRAPQEAITIDIAESTDTVDPTDSEVITSQSITLDGIVYRSDGKNTAWVNRSSTNEGNLETQFRKVDEKDVRSNQVKITLPDNQTQVDLKVGQQYDVNSREVRDMMKDPAQQGAAGIAEPRR
jgi:hypothetical protein